MGITLRTLLGGVSGDLRCYGEVGVAVSDITCDSRQVMSGGFFVAIPGVHEDGHAHLDEAVRRGARVVLIQQDRSSAWLNRLLGQGVTVLVGSSCRQVLSQLASGFYGDPSRRLHIVGVTGTNGKTTTTYLIRSLLEEAGHPTGLIGTVGYQVGDAWERSINTTPGALELHRMFDLMLYRGVSHVAMEVSSHALDQGRVDDVAFHLAVFTNLTQDHLDYHRTIEAYFDAKARLFGLLEKQRGCAVVNVDDPFGLRLRRMVGARLVTYGLDAPADYTARRIGYSIDETTCELVTPAGMLDVRVPLVGRHNVMNVLAATAVGLECGVPLSVVGAALERFGGVPGRLERVPVPAPCRVFIDYAHTPDGLRHVLSAVRSVPHRKLIVVFGCGGDRDRQKRPQMGAVATALADIVILTTDNPRSEDPDAILQEIRSGVNPQHRCCLTIADRASAIRHALSLVQSGDVVVIAGKGHEQYQIIGDATVPFDDRQVVQEAFACLPSPISL